MELNINKLKYMMENDDYCKSYYKKLQHIQLYEKIRDKIKKDSDICKELDDIYKKDIIVLPHIRGLDEFRDVFKIDNYMRQMYSDSEYMYIACELSILKSFCKDDNKVLDLYCELGGKHKELLKYIIMNKNEDEPLIEF